MSFTKLERWIESTTGKIVLGSICGSAGIGSTSLNLLAFILAFFGETSQGAPEGWLWVFSLPALPTGIALSIAGLFLHRRNLLSWFGILLSIAYILWMLLVFSGTIPIEK